MLVETELSRGTAIPDYLYMMRHTFRSEASRGSVKCLHRTDLVSALHNHTPFRCLNTSAAHFTCKGKVINEEDSILMHYSDYSPKCKTPNDPTNCTVHDRTAWRYFDLLQQNVQQQLQTIFGQ